MTDIYVGDYVTVTYSIIPSGRKVVFDGQVVEVREPIRDDAFSVPLRSIKVKPFIAAYRTQWWHRWQVESYRTESKVG